MSLTSEDYIQYRITKSKESLRDAKILAKNGSWNACINRLYYACYYIVSPLVLQNKINTQTHSGLKAQFNLHFVKTGILSKENGKLYSDLMDWRQKGNYGDMFDFEQDTVEPLLAEVENFISKVELLIS